MLQIKDKKTFKTCSSSIGHLNLAPKGAIFQTPVLQYPNFKKKQQKSKNKNKKLVILCIIRGLAIFTQNLCLVRLLVALTGNHSAVALEDLVNGDSSIMTFQSCCLWYGCFKDRNQVGNRLQPSSKWINVLGQQYNNNKMESCCYQFEFKCVGNYMQSD